MGYIGWILLFIIILLAISLGCATLLVLTGTAVRSLAKKYMKPDTGAAPPEKPAERPANAPPPPRPANAADISADKRMDNTAVTASVVILIVFLVGCIINSVVRTCDFIDRGY